MPIVSGLTVTLGDRVEETTQTTGTGTYALDGAATGRRTFVAGIGNGQRTLYTCELSGSSSYEIGIGTITSGAPATLSRDTILASSNSNNAVVWGIGIKTIFSDITAALANQIWSRPGGALPIGAVELRGPFSPNGSQIFIDITGIASTAKVIHVAWSNLAMPVTTNGLILQIGDSGGIETTGYAAGHAAILTSGFSAAADNAGAWFVLCGGQSAATVNGDFGNATLVHTGNGNLWTCTSIGYRVSSGTNYVTHGSGAKALSGTLDRVRIASGLPGSTNFNAGGTVSCQIIHAL